MHYEAFTNYDIFNSSILAGVLAGRYKIHKPTQIRLFKINHLRAFF